MSVRKMHHRSEAHAEDLTREVPGDGFASVLTMIVLCPPLWEPLYGALLMGKDHAPRAPPMCSLRLT